MKILASKIQVKASFSSVSITSILIVSYDTYNILANIVHNSFFHVGLIGLFQELPHEGVEILTLKFLLSGGVLSGGFLGVEVLTLGGQYDVFARHRHVVSSTDGHSLIIIICDLRLPIQL